MFDYKFFSFLKFVWPLLFLTAPLFIFSCYPPQNLASKRAVSRITDQRDDSWEDNRDETRGDVSRSSRTSCGRRDSYSDEVSITDLEFIDSNNVGEYKLKGRCEQRNELVYVTVNGYKTSSIPKCDKKRWEITLDLTSVAHEGDAVTFQITHNKRKLCKEVRVAFLGPKNYIPISPLEDYYESGFYVMKYEAKVNERGRSAKALSDPAGSPTTMVTHKEAQTLCQNNGSRFDLIRNEQWQNIARSIEEVDENWSQGRSIPTDDNTLNCGVARGIPKAASARDSDDCAARSCESKWDINRRTHILSNGERIWDICGNVGEIMKDKYRRNEQFKGYIYDLSSTLKKLFGPKRNYSLARANRRSATWGLGYAAINRNKDLIVRGIPGRDAGIFSVDVTSDQTNRRGYGRDIGFRCVYVP